MTSFNLAYLSHPIITLHGSDPTTQAISGFRSLLYNLWREFRNLKEHTNFVDNFGVDVVLVKILKRWQEGAVCQHRLSWSPIIIYLLSRGIGIIDPLGFDLHSVNRPTCNGLITIEFDVFLFIRI